MFSEADKRDTLIIITSDEPWGDVWHTQLHYAYHLSKQCTVYYIGPPAKWKLSNLFSWKFVLKKESDQLFVTSYHNVFPLGFMSGFFLWLNDLINCFLLIRKIQGNKTKIILWRFTYYRFLMVNFFKPFRTVYHVVDHYMGAKNDKLLAKKSDLVISTSPKFVEYYRGLNRNTINVPQAVNSEEFICDESIVNKIENYFHKIILFIGTFSWDISFEIFEKISEIFSDHTLLIIGPVFHAGDEERKRFEILISKNNVEHLGTVPGLKLKNYVKAAEVCIIPYKFGHEKKMTVRSPLKAISYLAQKKLVVTSIDCEIKELENKIIYTAPNLEEFMALMRKAIDKKLLVDEKAVEAFLKRISYDSCFEFIFSKLNSSNSEFPDTY